MTKALTEEQQLKIPEYESKYLAIATCTDPSDRPKAEDAARRIYELAGFKVPTDIRWFDGPVSAAKAIAEEKGGTYKDYMSWALSGQHEASWVAFYTFGEAEAGEVYDPTRSKQLAAFRDMCEASGWWFAMENTILLCERPEIISLEHDRKPPRYHNTKGPAIRFRDGYEAYYLRGTKVDKRLVMEPETITAEEVLQEDNVELRRILMAQMGEDKFLAEAKFEQTGEDSEGRLYVRGDLALLRVVNSTPEPDGTFKVVYLEVFPTLQQAKENCLEPLPGMKDFRTYSGLYTPHVARAWTFGVHPDEFVLAKET